MKVIKGEKTRKARHRDRREMPCKYNCRHSKSRSSQSLVRTQFTNIGIKIATPTALVSTVQEARIADISQFLRFSIARHPNASPTKRPSVYTCTRKKPVGKMIR